jgi:hypothetical protein
VGERNRGRKRYERCERGKKKKTNKQTNKQTKKTCGGEGEEREKKKVIFVKKSKSKNIILMI